MEVEHLFYLLVRWVPFYVPFTCLSILLCSLFYKDSVVAIVRNLLLLLLGTMSFIWLYTNLGYYVPGVVVPLLPLVYLCTLAAPILFYHFIYRLTGLGDSENFPKLHYALPLLAFLTVVCLMVFLPHNTLTHPSSSSDGSVVIWPKLTKMLPPLRLIFSVVYFIPGIMRIRRYRKAVLNYSSNEERVSLNWLYAIALLFVFQIVIVLIPTILGIGEHRGQFFNPFMVVVVVLIAFQAILLTYNTIMGNYVIISNEKTTNFEAQQQEPDNGQTAKNEDYKSLHFKKKMEKYFATAKPYLKPDLKITDLAKPLQTNRTWLSAFINDTYGMNFCKFVNSFRLTEYESLRTEAENSEMTNAELIVEAGFTNYRAYQRAKQQMKER